VIDKRYSKKKTAVLDLVRRYQFNRVGTEDGVDAEFLTERVAAIENEWYGLAAVTEANPNTFEDTSPDAERDTVAEDLTVRSSLGESECAIERLSGNIADLQLLELLQAVQKGYANQHKVRRETIEMLRTKKQHPQTFENEISSIQERLAEYERELNEFSESVRRRYAESKTSWRKELPQIIEKHAERRDDIEWWSPFPPSEWMVDLCDEVGALVGRLATDVQLECQLKIKCLGIATEARENITLPLMDVPSIMREAMQRVYENVKPETDDDSTGRRLADALLGRGWGNGLVGRMWKKYLENVREETVPWMARALVEHVVKEFETEVGKVTEATRASLQQVKKRKYTNEEVVVALSTEIKKMRIVEHEMARVDEMLEDLA